MTTTVVYGDTTDNDVTSSSAIFLTARAGTGTLALGTVTAVTSQVFCNLATGTYSIREPFLAFDTSPVGGDTVTAVELSCFLSTPTATDGAWELRARAFDWGAAVGTGDYRATNGTSAADPLLAKILSSAVTGLAQNAFTSEAAFPGAINGAGTTRLYLVSAHAENGVCTGANSASVRTADQTGTAEDPVLTIEHSGDTIVLGAQATETSTANAGTVSIRPAGAQATETDTANAGTPQLTVAGDQATETDTANAGSSGAVATSPGAQATETDTANAGTPQLTVAGDQATETDTANPGGSVLTSPGAQATETDTASSGTPRLTITGGRALELDTANAGTVLGAVIVVDEHPAVIYLDEPGPVGLDEPAAVVLLEPAALILQEVTA